MTHRRQRAIFWTLLAVLVLILPLLAACGGDATRPTPTSAAGQPAPGQPPPEDAARRGEPTARSSHAAAGPEPTASGHEAAAATQPPAASERQPRSKPEPTKAARTAPLPTEAPAPSADGKLNGEPTKGAVVGAVKVVPREGYSLSGQDRVGAPNLGAFLFFDADG